jgi:phosphoribosylanthranilate isomerase
VAVRVKVCGVTDPANALAAVELGADYLGLNFYPGSPRFVGVERALEIAGAVAGRVPLVGVFVNAPAAEVEEIAGRVGLDLLQFSGDEGPEAVAPFASRAIKAFRTGGSPGREAVAAYGGLWGILIDASHDVLYGGTGAAWDYGVLRGGAGALPGRLFLAGGIGPDNARRIAAGVRPYALDVCSRVESAPGTKDLDLLRRLFQEVRHGETQTPP